jgi:phage shock protein A
MASLFRRITGYWRTSVAQKFEEHADPAVQLAQAIQEAQEQHLRLRDQAANVIANQKHTEMRLNRAIEDVEKARRSAREALVLADEAAAAGNTSRANDMNLAAEGFATRLITLETEVESLKTLYYQSTDAAEQAKAAVEQSSVALRDRLAERQKLLSQLDQVKLQERMNAANAMLTEQFGQDVPTFDEVRQKIEMRYAKALGVAEVSSTGTGRSPEMAEVERETLRRDARSKLTELREQFGLPSGS